MLADSSLGATNKLYFSKLTGRTDANVLANKFIVPKNLQGIPGSRQHDTYFYYEIKELHLIFGGEIIFVSNSQTGESNTANETEYESIQDMFAGNMLKCKNLIEYL